MPPYTGKYNDVQKQAYYEYNLAWNYRRPKILKWLNRLKLYNNQRREEDKVGEPLIYDVHQTILSILYEDKLNVEFHGRTEDEEDQGDNLELLAENDYDEMEKAQLDFEWDWDASFFGSGYVLMNDFDTESKTPIPTVIDPTTFIFNPGMKWVNGNRAGEGKMLYGGYEVKLTKSMMLENKRSKSNPNGYFNINRLERVNDLYSLSGESERLRRSAQGLNDVWTFENSVVENYEYRILRWFTHIPDSETGISKKYIVELANNRMLPIRMIEIKKDYWPLIHRKFSPMSHDPDGVSVPDLTEDKQRYKAKILNVAGDIAQADLNGQYLFHEDRFRKTQDFSFKFGKWIPVKGNGSLADAAIPLQTKQVSETVKFILNYLDNAAKTATGTPNVQQGEGAAGPQGQDQTLGQTNLQLQAVGGRHSLTAKIFGWSEKEFWKHWYFLYDEYFDDALGAKIATLEGPFGTKWIPIKRKDIITGNTLGPKIKVESKQVSEASKMRLFNMMQGYVSMMAQNPRVNFDPSYTYRKMGKLIMPKQEVERVIPDSPEEMKAKEENEKLNDNELPKVLLSDDHNVHIRVHANADDTPATRRHIKIHQFMLAQKTLYPQSFPTLPGEQSPGNPMTPNAGAQPANQMNGAPAPTEGISNSPAKMQ